MTANDIKPEPPPTTPFQYGGADSVENGARYLGISRAKTWRLIRQRTLPCVRLGGRTLLRKVDCDALLARHLEAA
jgi:excisionase family DNA binding protein